MVRTLRRWYAGTLTWCITRNPAYLLSAGAMAVGAKLYLTAPDARAGDVGLILLTLGVLQAYELAVAGVLVLLHRRRRSPEDQPLLLLVAVLFWTGPLAATLELTEHHGQLGVSFAAAACLVALLVLGTVRRTLGLRLSPSGQVAAVLCLALVAAAPGRLRVPYGAPGTDELALYVCWWLLGAFALMALPAVRWHVRKVHCDAVPRRALRAELVFVGIVVASAAAHLWAMNYAFYGNARPFYAVPLLGAIAVVAFETLAVTRTRNRVALFACAGLPVIGILLAGQGFHPRVPVHDLPAVVRDPLVATLLIAAGAWWYGMLRHRSTALLHAGSLAAAVAVIRVLPFTPSVDIGPTIETAYSLPLPIGLAFGAWCVTAYLLVTAWVRWSRTELLAAFATNLLAVVVVVLGRGEFDVMVVLFATGWSWLVAVHVPAWCPGRLARLMPVALLIGTACWFEFDESLRWIARLHALGMTVVLFGAGCVWRRTGYRLVGGVGGLVWLLLVCGRVVAGGPNAGPALAVSGAFLLLSGAAATSWYKQRLLVFTRSLVPRTPKAGEPEGDGARAP